MLPAVTAIDPNAAALPDSGIFGLDSSEADSRVVLTPVPFDATTSYRKGAARGPAAILAKENIKKVEVVEFPELGMEAIWKIEVEDFPAFILVDDKGTDFFQSVGPGCSVKH